MWSDPTDFPRLAQNGSPATPFGALAAFTGIEHGLGEISQGSVAPPAVVFQSWPHVSAFDPLSDPAG
jgi:hypothetical protein